MKSFFSFFLVSCLPLAIQCAVTWEGPSTMYIGFPGATTEKYAFLGKYSTAFVASTGEAVITKSVDIVQPYKTFVIKFPEIIDPRNCWWFQRAWNGFWRQKTWARQTGAKCITPTSCGYSIASYGVNRARVNMGQQSDIECMRRQLNCLWSIIEPLEYKTVWIAYSRGVTAALRYCVQYPRARTPDAFILEGGVDSVPHFLSHMFLGYASAWTQGALFWGFKTFFAPSYQHEPWDYTLYCISKIPAHIPVLLVTCFADELVSYHSTLRMYHHFKRARGPFCDNVHVLILSKARHSYYTSKTANPLDCRNYEQCVHAFYKKYGLAYDEQLAAEGSEIFKRTNEIKVSELLQGSGCSTCNAVCHAEMTSSLFKKE